MSRVVVLGSIVVCLGLAASACGSTSSGATTPGRALSDREAPVPFEPPATLARRAAVESSLSELVSTQVMPDRFTIEERMRHYRVPGVSVAVIRGGQIDWARGYGLRSASSPDPVDTETLFQVGSISKPVSAFHVMQLAEQGKIRLDEDIDPQLTAWQIPHDALRNDVPITPRMVLGHRGGLSMAGVSGFFFDESPATLLGILRGTPDDQSSAYRRDTWRRPYPPVEVQYPPGQQWRYSGGGYCALMLLAEEMDGASFPTAIRRQLLSPLGMRRSTFEQFAMHELPKNVADGHLEHGEVFPGRSQRLPCVTAAGLWTNAKELALFMIEVQRALQGESDLLSDESARAMVTAGRPAPPLFEGYGLGFVIEGLDDSPRFGHHGSNGIFNALTVASFDGSYGAVVLTNGWEGFPLAEEILNAIARVYSWPGYELQRRSERPKEQLHRYTGHFMFAGGRAVEVALEDDGALWLRIEGDDEQALFPSDDGNFFILREGHARPVRFTLERGNEEASAFELQMGPRTLRAVRSGSRPN